MLLLQILGLAVLILPLIVSSLSLLRKEDCKKKIKSIICLLIVFYITIPMLSLREVLVSVIVSSHPLISEVYGGEGNSVAQYKNYFIKLYNPASSVVDFTGWKTHYVSSIVIQ